MVETGGVHDRQRSLLKQQSQVLSLFSRNMKLIIEGITVEKTEDLVKIYKPLYCTYKATPRSLLYTNYSIHEAKITHYAKRLSDIIKKHPHMKILDIGCGYGSLAPHVPSANYHGIDILPEFITEARQQYQYHQFSVSSLESWNEHVDISVFAGVMGSIPFPFALLQKAWSISTTGVLVDFNDTARMQTIPKNPDCVTYTLDIVEKQLRNTLTRNFTREDKSIWSIYFLQKT